MRLLEDARLLQDLPPAARPPVRMALATFAPRLAPTTSCALLRQLCAWPRQCRLAMLACLCAGARQALPTLPTLDGTRVVDGPEGTWLLGPGAANHDAGGPNQRR